MHELPSLPTPAAFVPLALLALLLLRFARAWPAVVMLAAIGWTAWCAQARLDERLPETDVRRDVAVAGYVDGFPEPAPGQVTFSFAVDAPRPAGVPPRLRLTWYDPPAGLRAGDPLRIVARLRPPHGLRNPGGFDYERWLMVSGHGASGYVRSVAPVGERDRSLRERWLAFRNRIAERLAAHAPAGDGAALLVALALGERYLFSEQHWADFRRTGTSHLVAVSGMHVALLGVVVFVALRKLWLCLPQPLASFDLEAAAAASAICTAFYAALTGFAVPAQRSLLMIVVGLALLVTRRSVGAVQALAAALVAVLALDPFAPLTASFWLSFVAVALLLALAAPRRARHERGSRVRRWIGGGAALAGMQWSIGLALLPLTAFAFAEIPLLGAPVNLLAIPWFNVLLVPLTIAATLATMLDPLAAAMAPALGWAAGSLAGYTVAALHWLAEWPHAALAVAPRAGLSLLAACGVLCALPIHPFRGRRLAWLAVAPLFLAPAQKSATGEATVTVLDVGHGLAVIVETAEHRLLFDAGPSFRSGFDSGEEVVLPALLHGGRRRLDRLIVSHADNDHSGGARAVLAAYPDVHVLHGPDVRDLPGERCIAGNRWEWDDVRFSILHPPAGFAALGNDSSCVLKIDAPGGSVLITGDIEARGEARVTLRDDVAADVVVVPHHGSATSSTAAFVRAVDADLAIVSAGYANRWGFPKPDVRARWEGNGAAMLVTADSGAVTVQLGRTGWRVRRERDGRHRYWHNRAEQGAISLENQS